MNTRAMHKYLGTISKAASAFSPSSFLATDAVHGPAVNTTSVASILTGSPFSFVESMADGAFPSSENSRPSTVAMVTSAPCSWANSAIDLVKRSGVTCAAEEVVPITLQSALIALLGHSFEVITVN